MTAPGYGEYFADPFVLRLADGTYAAYGSGRPPHRGAAVPARVFEALHSADLVSWEPRGLVLDRLDPSFGDEYWAPEVAYEHGAYWMYYSVGRGIEGHHVRVARADTPFGPFLDLGINLTEGESFAIDAHPFRDDRGDWYLMFARDVLDHERPGTHIAVARLVDMTTLVDTRPALAPNADWQLFERHRAMYDGRYDWHTLEGPAVVFRTGRYWLTYSGGAWTGPGYAVSWAVADSPFGPWTHAPEGAAPLLATDGTWRGPGHNSLTVAPSGEDAIVFHSWDLAKDARLMHVRQISFEPEGPRVDGPIRGPSLSGR